MFIFHLRQRLVPTSHTSPQTPQPPVSRQRREWLPIVIMMMTIGLVGQRALAQDASSESPAFPEAQSTAQSEAEVERRPLGYVGTTFDGGISVGSFGGRSYTETYLGANSGFFGGVAVWRNAAFGRFGTGFEDIYGLDSSLRSIARLEGESLSLTAFAGPGYRFASRGSNVPFAEGGAILRWGGLSVGGGIKTLLYELIDSDGFNGTNDTQYFVILAGSVRL